MLHLLFLCVCVCVCSVGELFESKLQTWYFIPKDFSSYSPHNHNAIFTYVKKNINSAVLFIYRSYSNFPGFPSNVFYNQIKKFKKWDPVKVAVFPLLFLWYWFFWRDQASFVGCVTFSICLIVFSMFRFRLNFYFASVYFFFFWCVYFLLHHIKGTWQVVPLLVKIVIANSVHYENLLPAL